MYIVNATSVSDYAIYANKDEPTTRMKPMLSSKGSSSDPERNDCLVSEKFHVTVVRLIDARGFEARKMSRHMRNHTNMNSQGTGPSNKDDDAVEVMMHGP